MVSKKELDTRRSDLLELFKLADKQPEQAQQAIQQVINPPYSRDLSDNITESSINNLGDYYLENYYNDWLYKIWNYAEKIKQ